MTRHSFALAGALVFGLAVLSAPADAQFIDDFDDGPAIMGLADPYDDEETVIERVVRPAAVQRVIETVEEAPVVRRRVTYRSAAFAPPRRVVTRRVRVREPAFVAPRRIVTRRVVVREPALVAPAPVVRRRVVVREDYAPPREIVRVRRNIY